MIAYVFYLPINKNKTLRRQHKRKRASKNFPVFNMIIPTILYSTTTRSDFRLNNLISEYLSLFKELTAKKHNNIYDLKAFLRPDTSS